MRSVRGPGRFLVPLGLGALAVAGVVVAVFIVNRNGGGASATATTGPYAPITVLRPKIYKMAGSVMNDPDASVATNLGTLASRLPGRNRYRITVTNTSNVGFVKSFQWYPPTGIHVVRVIGSSAGNCEVSGLTGFGGAQFKTVLLYPNVTCNRIDLKPPSCTCLGDGGAVGVSVVTDRPLVGIGSVTMISARLVLKPIPSYLQPQTGSTAQSTSGG